MNGEHNAQRGDDELEEMKKIVKFEGQQNILRRWKKVKSGERKEIMTTLQLERDVLIKDLTVRTNRMIFVTASRHLMIDNIEQFVEYLATQVKVLREFKKELFYFLYVIISGVEKKQVLEKRNIIIMCQKHCVCVMLGNSVSVPISFFIKLYRQKKKNGGGKDVQITTLHVKDIDGANPAYNYEPDYYIAAHTTWKHGMEKKKERTKAKYESQIAEISKDTTEYVRKMKEGEKRDLIATDQNEEAIDNLVDDIDDIQRRRKERRAKRKKRTGRTNVPFRVGANAETTGKKKKKKEPEVSYVRPNDRVPEKKNVYPAVPAYPDVETEDSDDDD